MTETVKREKCAALGARWLRTGYEAGSLTGGTDCVGQVTYLFVGYE
jgi:hypothetical protein